MTDTLGQQRHDYDELLGGSYSLRCRNPDCGKSCHVMGHGRFLGFQCSCGWVNNVDTINVPSGDLDEGRK